MPKIFPPIPSRYRTGFGLLIGLLGASAAAVAYSLQTNELVITAAATGFLGAFIGLVQWMVGQLREAARTRWEAIKAYYSEGDGDRLRIVRAEIFADNFNNAGEFCNFFEKWGRLVEQGYLPLEVFDGPSGVSISNAVVKLKIFIRDHRQNNPRYASHYLSLVAEIHKNDFLKGTTAHDDVQTALSQIYAG